MPGSNGEGKAGKKKAEVKHTYTDHPGYQIPPPDLFIQHLKDRLSGVVADAFRVSRFYGYDLPEEFEDHVARANTELTVWQRVVNKKRLEQEHPGSFGANGGIVKRVRERCEKKPR